LNLKAELPEGRERERESRVYYSFVDGEA